jgi:opacity protein-like surface antigen
MLSTINNQRIYMKKILLASLLALPVMAIAADNQGPYAGVEVGYTRIDNTAQQTANNLVGAVGGSAAVTSDSGMAIGKLFAGYQFTENFSAEIGAYRTSDFDMKAAGISSGGTAYTASSSTNIYGVEGSFLIRPNVSTGLNGLFGRFGGHWDKAESDVSAAGAGATATGNYWVSGSGFLAGAGYDVNVDKNLTGRVSYTYYDNVAGTDAYANVGSLALMYKF